MKNKALPLDHLSPTAEAPQLTGDLLKDIMAFQDFFNGRVSGTKAQFEQMSPDIRSEWLSRMVKAANHEGCEMEAELCFKWWKENQNFDILKARMEWIDRFHFVLSEALVLGMDADMVYRMYMEKNKVNHERQASGY